MKRYLNYSRKFGLAASLSLLPISSNAKLIGYWTFDDDSFDDSSGNGNNGTFFGGTAYADDSPAVLGGGKSVTFDGVAGTYGAINSDSGGLKVTSLPSYTVSMWVKGDGTANSDDRIFSEGTTTDNNPLFNVGTHNGSADGTVDVFVRNGDTFGHEYTTGEAFDDSWHHVAWVDNAGLLDLYIDGVLDRQFDYSIVPEFEADTTTIGGILRAGDCCNFLGSIDDVAIWDEALTAEDIASIAAGADIGDVVEPPEDADEDGLPDAWELENGLSIADDGSTDINNGPDGDPDNDGSKNSDELKNNTDPQDDDSDDDDLKDGEEAEGGTDPLKPDTDEDGLEDGEESDAGTNPLLTDTDGDGIGDNAEITSGTDPLDIENPAIGGLLCAYWPLDSTDGTTTPDLGPNAYDLELMNMDASNFVDEDGRLAASFDGIDTLLARRHGIDDGLPITKHPAFTISMWVKVEGTGQNDLRFFSESSSLNGNPLFNLGTRNNGSDNTLDVYLRDAGSPNHQFSNTEPLDGTWRHIAYTHNEANEVISVYVDGVLDRDDWTFKDVVSGEVDTTSVGAILRADPSHWVNGFVDDVSLWKGVMSPAKIAQLAGGASPAEIAGTAKFLITSIERDADGNVSFSWNSRPGAEYGIFASTDLVNWNELDDAFPSDGEETTYTLFAGTAGLDPATESRIFFYVTRQ